MARQALAVLALTVLAAEALVDPQFQSFLNVGKLRNRTKLKLSYCEYSSHRKWLHQ